MSSAEKQHVPRDNCRTCPVVKNGKFRSIIASKLFAACVSYVIINSLVLIVKAENQFSQLVNRTSEPKLNSDVWSIRLSNTQITDHVRCYCNLPICVSSGYMCISKNGGCFSNIIGANSDLTKANYGCVDFLADSEYKTQCLSRSQSDKWVQTGHLQSLLLCCFKNVCNHIDSPDTRFKLNSTLLNLRRNASLSISPSGFTTNLDESYSNSEMYLKIAIVVIPIIGAFVLFMLVCLAIKILRSDADKLDNYASPSCHKSPLNIDMQYDNNLCTVTKKMPFNDSVLINCHYDKESLPNVSNGAGAPLLFHFDKNDKYARINATTQLLNVSLPITNMQNKLYYKDAVPR